MEYQIRESFQKMSDEDLEKMCQTWGAERREYKLAIEERLSRQNRRTHALLESNQQLLKTLNDRPHPVLIWTLVFTGLCFLASAIAALSSIPLIRAWLSGLKWP